MHRNNFLHHFKFIANRRIIFFSKYILNRLEFCLSYLLNSKFISQSNHLTHIYIFLKKEVKYTKYRNSLSDNDCV